MRPTSLGSLRRAVDKGRIPRRSIKRELRDNLMARLRSDGPLFPGIVGYDESVIPQVVNAILSQHDFVVLGLRGQAKTRLLRGLAELLDESIPVVPGCDINDDPLAPICAACRARVQEEGNDLPVAWLDRSMRYVEKLATPDVTIADMIGDIDPIKAASAGRRLSDELTVPLRAPAARQPLHLRHQRAPRPGRQDPGRPVQHPAGRRHPDSRLPRSPCGST